MRSLFGVSSILLAAVLLSGCAQSGGEDAGDETADTGYTDEAVKGQIIGEGLRYFPLNPTDDYIEEFRGIFGTERELWNITPEGFYEDHGFRVFKDYDCDSYLLYDGEVYGLGIGFGGWGVTSLAVTDIDGNGFYELYFTYSWGSGIHRGQAGYFDTSDKTVKTFPYSFLWADSILLFDEDGTLGVYACEITEYGAQPFVDMGFSPIEKISDIALGEDGISLPTLEGTDVWYFPALNDENRSEDSAAAEHLG